MSEGKKKSNLRWVVLYGFAIIIDVVQILIDLTGVGIVVSEIMEVITGPVLIGLFTLFKISIITKPKRIASLLGLALGDAITGGMAPFWVVDVWYIQRDVKKEEAAEQAKQEQEVMLSNAIRQPLYRDGTRQPTKLKQENTDIGARNRGGIRAPNGMVLKK